MNSFIFEKRLRDLEDNLQKDYELLKEYENELRYATEPKTKVRYRNEISQLKDSAKKYQKDYEVLAERLKNDSVESGEVEQFSRKLNDIADMIELLLGGQRLLHDNQQTIHHDLVTMRQSLLAYYDAGERSIIEVVTSKLDANQIAMTQTLLDGVNNSQLSDSEIQAILSVLKTHANYLPDDETQAVFGVIDTPEMSFRHRLKVAIPLIPQLLPFLPSVDYEGELELGTDFDTQTAWQMLKGKLLGK